MQIDQMLHTVADRIDKVRWRDCKEYGAKDDTYEWYYAEDELYIIRHKQLGHIYFISARSPVKAVERLERRCEGVSA